MLKVEFGNPSLWEKHIDTSDVAIKKTGLTVGIVLILISLLLWYLGKSSFMYFSTIGGLFIILALIATPVLGPFHKLWMILALLMGFVMSRVILTILFYRAQKKSPNNLEPRFIELLPTFRFIHSI